MDFIVIDDSKLDCFIAEKIIKNTGGTSVKSFLQASDALAYLKDTPVDPNHKTIILVDIQMPVMNGFDFVEEFEKLSPKIIAGYYVYIISSSINENDLNRVQNYSSVIQFINKPLTSINLKNIMLALSENTAQ